MADDNLFKQVGDVQEFAKNGNVKLLRFNTKNNLEYLTTTTKPHVDNIIKAVIEHYGLSSKTKIHININLYKFVFLNKNPLTPILLANCISVN